MATDPRNEIRALAERCRAIADRKPWLAEMADRLEQAADAELADWAVRRTLLSAITLYARSILDAYARYEEME